jgi:hypothetical protein
MARRDSYPVDLIRREVLAKGRRALVVYGDMHLQRRALDFNYETFDDPSRRDIVRALESGTSATKVFTIWTNTAADVRTLEADVATWRKPSVAMTRGSVFGAADFTFYFPFPQERQTVRDGSLVPPSRTVAHASDGRPVRRGSLPWITDRNYKREVVGSALHGPDLPQHATVAIRAGGTIAIWGSTQARVRRCHTQVVLLIGTWK